MVYWQIDNILIHTLPFFYTAINLFLLSDMTIKYSDFWLVPMVSLLYLLCSYVWTKKTGYAVYSFLTWEEDDVGSKVFTVVCLIGGALMHLILAYYTEQIYGRSEVDS
jgi:hypothetical protein